MVIKNLFEYGETVYLKTDPHQQERIITAFTLRGANITYELSICELVSWHSDVEITRDFDELKKIQLGE
jgi:hypothetical protein